MPLTRADCERLDEADLLGGLRESFAVPERLIYLDGNSLGIMPRQAANRAAMVLKEWEEHLVGGWNDAGWWDLPITLGDKIARLLGAAPGTMVVTDNTTSNLFKVINAAIARDASGDIVAATTSFPSDLYVAADIAARHGRRLRLVGRDAESLTELLEQPVAVVVIEHVDFRTGALADMKAVTSHIHDRGALVIWDLSHSAGVVPVELAACGADFAVGCTYKYLNGGPGSPAYVYVAPHLITEATQPIPGWLGHAEPFRMEPDYRPSSTIRRFLTGTPSIVAMRVLESSIDLFDGIDISAVRAKSAALTDLFIRLVDERSPEAEVVSPRQAAMRGSQVSLRHQDGRAITRDLIAAGVRGDFRAPDLLRFGFAPLYLRFTDVWDAVDVLATVLDQRSASASNAEDDWHAPT
ncbi:MAG: kynureninase [Actinomycetota bacterium]